MRERGKWECLDVKAGPNVGNRWILSWRVTMVAAMSMGGSLLHLLVVVCYKQGGFAGARSSSGSGGRRPRSAVGGAAVRIGACVQSAVACTGKELETYVGSGGCFAFLPGPWLCWGCAVRSSGRRRSGRFGCTSVMGVRSKRPMAAEMASARRAGRGDRRTCITA